MAITVSGLTTYLTSLGVTLPNGNSLSTLATQAILDLAVQDLSSKTGWYPLVSSGANTAEVYSPPGPKNGPYASPTGMDRKLRLRTALLSVQSLTIEGVPCTLGTDFWLVQFGNNPPTLIEFFGPIWKRMQSVVITGEWGRYSANSAPAWIEQLVYQYAAGMLQSNARELMIGRPAKYKEAHIEEAFDMASVSSLLRMGNLVDSHVKATIEGLKRVDVGA